MANKRIKVNIQRLFYIIVILEIILVCFLGANRLFVLEKKLIKLREDTAVLDQETIKANETKALESILAEKETVLAEIENKIFDDKTLLAFFKNFNDDVNNYKLDITSLSLGELVPFSSTNNKVKKLAVSANLTGSYDDCSNYVKHLENFAHLMTIKSISLTGDSINLTFTVYVRTESEKYWSYKE